MFGEAWYGEVIKFITMGLILMLKKFKLRYHRFSTKKQLWNRTKRDWGLDCNLSYKVLCFINFLFFGK